MKSFEKIYLPNRALCYSLEIEDKDSEEEEKGPARIRTRLSKKDLSDFTFFIFSFGAVDVDTEMKIIQDWVKERLLPVLNAPSLYENKDEEYIKKTSAFFLFRLKVDFVPLY